MSNILEEQAFPVQDDNKLVGECGMSKLEYFASRAPHEIPKWFMYEREGKQWLMSEDMVRQAKWPWAWAKMVLESKP